MEYQQLAPGSPPRVRGTAHVVEDSCGVVGIIPACAGNSGRRGPCSTSARDHPRVCGEQFLTVE